MRLSAIERLYVYAEGLWPHDSLDAIIARQDLKRIHDLLHGFFSMLRNSGLRSGRPSERAWLAARRFAVGTCELLAYSGGPGRLRRLRDALDGLSRLDHHLAVGRNKRLQRPPGRRHRGPLRAGPSRVAPESVPDRRAAVA
jgi:hypothetical protein